MNEKKTPTRSRAIYIVLAFLISFSFWVYVTAVENPDVTVRLHGIPVTLTWRGNTDVEEGLAENGFLLLKGEGQTVSLKLKGKRSAVTQIRKDNLKLTADLSGIAGTGKQELTYSVVVPQTNGIVQVVERSQEKIAVEVGRLDEKTLPLEGVFSGSAAEGYLVRDIILPVSEVTVSGDAEMVEQIKRAVVEFSGENLTQTQSDEYPVLFLDGSGNPISSSHIYPSVDRVHATLPILARREVPLSITVKPGGGVSLADVRWSIEPGTVTVLGDEHVLASHSFLSLGEISMTDVFESFTLPMEIPLPEGVELFDPSTEAVVTLTVSDAFYTRLLTVDDVRAVNSPEGVSVTVDTRELSVTMRGRDVDRLMSLGEHLHAEADLSVLDGTPGTYTVPVRIVIDGYSQAGVVGRYQAKVTVRPA